MARGSALPVTRIILWQPLLSGQAVTTDLLRIRVAADSGAGTTQSVGALRAELAAGRPVEAAGYMLTPELYGELNAQNLAAGERPAAPLTWIEVISSSADTGRPAATQALAALTADGATAELRVCRDPPFWSTTEVTEGTATVAETLAAMRPAA
jgi:hypothetical protein